MTLINPRRMRSEGYSSLSVCLSVCLCVCVLGMGGIKSQGGKFEKGNGRLELGKDFVSVTQHAIPHASDIDVYLLQHSQASTTPHIPPAYALRFAQIVWASIF